MTPVSRHRAQRLALIWGPCLPCPEHAGLWLCVLHARATLGMSITLSPERTADLGSAGAAAATCLASHQPPGAGGHGGEGHAPGRERCQPTTYRWDPGHGHQCHTRDQRPRAPTHSLPVEHAAAARCAGPRVGSRRAAPTRTWKLKMHGVRRPPLVTAWHVAERG